jgi:hypothetical protein
MTLDITTLGIPNGTEYSMRLKVATYLGDGVPNMGVKNRGKKIAYFFPSSHWHSYLGHATVQIMTNYISHEKAHQLLEEMGMHKANDCIDNFTSVHFFHQKCHAKDRMRQLEIAEPSGLENLILAVESRRRHR